MRYRVQLFIAVLLVSTLLTFCKSQYKASSEIFPSKEAKKKEAADRKSLKQQIKLQAKKRKELDKLEHKERTPTQVDKHKKGTPKSPETFY